MFGVKDLQLHPAAPVVLEDVGRASPGGRRMGMVLRRTDDQAAALEGERVPEAIELAGHGVARPEALLQRPDATGTSEHVDAARLPRIEIVPDGPRLSDGEEVALER